MKCVCSTILVDFMTYLGSIGAWGMHFPGIHTRASFGCDDSASMCVPLLPSISYCRYWSRRCGGGSKGVQWACEFSGLLFFALQYKGIFTPLSTLILLCQWVWQSWMFQSHAERACSLQGKCPLIAWNLSHFRVSSHVLLYVSHLTPKRTPQVPFSFCYSQLNGLLNLTRSLIPLCAFRFFTRTWSSSFYQVSIHLWVGIECSTFIMSNMCFYLLALHDNAPWVSAPSSLYVFLLGAWLRIQACVFTHSHCVYMESYFLYCA